MNEFTRIPNNLEILTKEETEFIKNLAHEISTQDTRATAKPYGLVIRNEKKEIRDFHYCDNRGVYWNESEYDSFDEFKESFIEYYTEDESEINAEIITFFMFKIRDIEDLRNYEHDLYNDFDISITTHGYEKVMTADASTGNLQGNFFLTEKAALDFIEKNKHNLNNPDTYGIHLYRNPEMEQLISIILKLGNSDLIGGK